MGAQTRKRILDTARRNFGAKGYSAATNSDVAEEAGITTGAIYHYFPSKKDLYRTVFEDSQKTIYDGFRASVAGVDGCVAKLHAVLDAVLALQQEDPSLAKFIVSVSSEARRHPELVDLYDLQDADQRGFFLPIVEEGVRTGELRATDVDLMIEMVVAVLGGLARYATVTPDLGRHTAAVLGFQLLLEGELLSAPASMTTQGLRRRVPRALPLAGSARSDVVNDRSAAAAGPSG